MARTGELSPLGGGLLPPPGVLGAVLAGSMLLHGAVLGIGARSPEADSVAGSRYAVATVQVVPVPLQPSTPAAPAPSADTASDPVYKEAAVPAEPAPMPLEAAPAVAPVPPGTPDGLEYLARDRLSVVPAPVEEVVVPFPESMGYEFRAGVRLALFIDETGAVRHVRVEQSNVGPDFEQAARGAFLAARFTPGEVDGRPVKSVVRVEVEFESRLRVEPPTPAASAARP